MTCLITPVKSQEAATPQANSSDPAQKSGISGIDQSLFSDSVSAGENFYLHANQKWLDATEIPADKSNYGIFTLLDDMTRAQVRELIEQAAASDSSPGSAAQKVGAFLTDKKMASVTLSDAEVPITGAWHSSQPDMQKW